MFTVACLIFQSPVPCSMWDTQFTLRSSALASPDMQCRIDFDGSHYLSVEQTVRGYIHMHSPVFSAERLTTCVSLSTI